MSASKAKMLDSDIATPVITLLAGGVGGAKAAEGLQVTHYAENAAVIGNIGDDDIFHGLKVCPDIDTLIYSLSDQIDRAKGWGLKEEQYQVLGALSELGRDIWMTLGDKDFATHIYRSCALNSGLSLTEVTAQIARRFNVDLSIMPPTDDPVPTQLYFNGCWNSFQRYFVQHQCQPEIEGIRYARAEQARPSESVLRQLAASDIILLAPSNPFVSIGAILAIPDIKKTIQSSTASVIAISPFISGKTVKGPADAMMRAMGYEAGNAALATHYADLIQGLVIDTADQNDTAAIEAQGIAVLCTDTLMQNLNDKQRVVTRAIEWALELSSGCANRREVAL